eukprot:TRINITY_DN8068_c0_g1_i1.p1 TRINITY_DN8068_c0_g1~~TRINITY_DN8068_c0_g1_i1.p1  ORF type:complete len:728 (+),score=150.25 TRINITY_DN8068_c0_g1_i1:83-2266(+)
MDPPSWLASYKEQLDKTFERLQRDQEHALQTYKQTQQSILAKMMADAGDEFLKQAVQASQTARDSSNGVAPCSNGQDRHGLEPDSPAVRVPEERKGFLIPIDSNGSRSAADYRRQDDGRRSATAAQNGGGASKDAYSHLPIDKEHGDMESSTNNLQGVFSPARKLYKSSSRVFVAAGVEEHCADANGQAPSSNCATGLVGTTTKFIQRTDLNKKRFSFQDALLDSARLAGQAGGAGTGAADAVASKLEEWHYWWEHLEEPKRTGLASKVIKHSNFEALCVTVIVLNSIWIWHTTDRSIESLSTDTTTFHAAMEMAFVTYYSLELGLKLYVHRMFFFLNEAAGWNIFDFFLVFVSLLELTILPWLASSSGEGAGGTIDIKFLRAVRLLKLAKVLRMIRALQFVSNLRLFVACLVGCGPSLFWAVIIILLILVVFSMFLVQALTLYAMELGDKIDQDLLAGIQKYFGSVGNGIITLFQCVSGGRDWEEVYATVGATGGVNSAVFLFFVFFFVIAVWNIVTSIFIERTMDLAQPDIEGAMMIKRQRDSDDAKELLQLCELVDRDGSKTISCEEFEDFIQNEHLRQYFDVRGIDIKDAQMFYQMLCAAAEVGDNEEVDIETFIGGCLRLKGLASSIDVQTLAYESKLMHCMQKKFFSYVQSSLSALDKRVASLGKPTGSPCGVPTVVGGGTASEACSFHMEAVATPGDEPVPAQPLRPSRSGSNSQALCCL